MANCPYCNKALSKTPERKTKCEYCGNFIYVKRKPGEEIKKLVTEEQANAIEKLWEQKFENDQLMTYVRHAGATEEEFNQAKAHWKGRLSDKDIILRISNDKVTEILSKKKPNYHDAKVAYFSMAILAAEMGIDFFFYLQQSAKCELLNYKQDGFIKQVEIQASDKSCEECKKNHGKRFTIKKALELMPIPCKNCTTDNVGKGWCRCYYSPVMDDED